MIKNARILIVDDDEIVRDSLSITLEQEGYNVDTACNGKEAVEMSYQNYFNLAIIDWRLPDITGTELLGKLKKNKPKTYKILLTGYPSMNNAIDAMNERADAFLLKPVNFQILSEKIVELLGEQEEIKQLLEYADIALKISKGSSR